MATVKRIVKNKVIKKRPIVGEVVMFRRSHCFRNGVMFRNPDIILCTIKNERLGFDKVAFGIARRNAGGIEKKGDALNPTVGRDLSQERARMAINYVEKIQPFTGGRLQRHGIVDCNNFKNLLNAFYKKRFDIKNW